MTRRHSRHDPHRVRTGGRGTIWNKGPLAYIPNGYVRRPLKAARAAISVPSMALRARNGGVADARLPDFLGIGAARAGTTWLHFNLAAHPEITMPVTKEQRFWNANLSRGVNAYSRAFAHAPQDHRVGEITPAYGIMDAWRVRLMAQVMPNVRLVHLMRNPVERAWSHLAMWARNRNLSPSDLSHEQIVEVLTSEPCTLNGMYSDVHRTFSEAFSREQLFVGFYEDLQERPHELLEEIFAHIGVSTGIDWDELPLERRFNSGLGIEDQDRTSSDTMPDEYRALLSTRYEMELRQLAQTFRGPAERWAEEAVAFTR